jgi:hypothetical protein
VRTGGNVVVRADEGFSGRGAGGFTVDDVEFELFIAGLEGLHGELLDDGPAARVKLCDREETAGGDSLCVCVWERRWGEEGRYDRERGRISEVRTGGKSSDEEKVGDGQRRGAGRGARSCGVAGLQGCAGWVVPKGTISGSPTCVETESRGAGDMSTRVTVIRDREATRMALLEAGGN